MNPELFEAVKERFTLGHTKEQIASELRAAGYDDASIENVYASVSGASSMHSANLASADIGTMLGEAWRFMTSRLDLVALLAVISLLPGVFVFGIEQGWFSEFSTGMILPSVIGVIALFALQVLVQLSFAHAALNDSLDKKTPYSESWKFALAHFWGWLWIGLVLACVVFGASLFFIIPGIVASIYTILVLYCYADEGVRGMAALQRSRELVTGNFWFVLGRVFVLFLVMLLIAIGMALIVGLLGSLGALTFGLVWVGVEALFTSAMTVLSISYFVQLYKILKSRNFATLPPTVWYTIAGVIGVILFVLGSVFAGIGIGTMMTGGLDALDLDLESVSADMTPEEQAEFKAFMEEFGAELDVN